MAFKSKKVKAKAYSKYPRNEAKTAPIKKTHGVTMKSGRASIRRKSHPMK